MKSRSYKALALKDANGATLGIVCLESTDLKGLGEITREEMQQSFTHFIILLEALEHHIASLDNAISEGL